MSLLPVQGIEILRILLEINLIGKPAVRHQVPGKPAGGNSCGSTVSW